MDPMGLQDELIAWLCGLSDEALARELLILEKMTDVYFLEDSVLIDELFCLYDYARNVICCRFCSRFGRNG